ncbi:hypothetical protein L210DRAFT_3410509 [Boletus edulis BED1]|uniref:Pyridoxamine 5'-phosphate oxidase putative domain-containing protein n=1 Tax=Boletus edulis BED1 TaxID=1328754 RepID=A0AAD4GBE6_BOLED|nr:hypothetical protein L210DRAFT_3410509 [Boletus edulis BED1]
MAKYYDEIPEWLLEWIQKQHMFWVASAPLSTHGHVNLSPKGTADCFHVVNSKQVWYEDLSGSGVETISHLRENGRVTIMFSAFEGPPRILRLWGTGTVHEYGTPEYSALIPAETRKPGSRAAIVIDVYQTCTSCGYAVPLYDFVKHRTQLLSHFDKLETEQSEPDVNDPGSKGAAPPSDLRGYWLLKNIRSLDGLPGLVTAPDAIRSMIPHGRFDKDTRPMKRSRKGVGYLQALVPRDRTSFISGFMSSVVAMLVLVVALGKLKL